MKTENILAIDNFQGKNVAWIQLELSSFNCFRIGYLENE